MKTEKDEAKKPETKLEPPRPKGRKKASPNYSPQELARREQWKINRRLKKAEKEQDLLKQKKQRIRKKQEALNEVKDALAGNTKNGKIVSDESLEALPEAISAGITDYIFKPNPGPQTEFLASSEFQVLYGGAAGGGKSYALLADAIRDAWHPEHAALVIRRTLDELRELINKSKTIYPEAYPGATWSVKNSTWTFPSGATVWFTYADNDDDLTRFQGQAWNYIAFDELTHWPTPNAWDFLSSRCRATSGLDRLMRATTNPGGVGAWWVKRMFIDPAEHGEAFWATDISTQNNSVMVYPEDHSDKDKRGRPLFKRRFIPARLSDNPYLFKDGQYEATLRGLPEAQRRRLLEGDWDVTEGAAFPEFRRSVHVCEPFKIPNSWPKFRAADYGYREPACCLWFAVDYDGCLYVYRELYGPGLDAIKFAERVIELERDAQEHNMIGWLDSSVWARKGDIGPSIAEQMIRAGCRWIPSDRSPGSRVSGKLELHRRLRVSDEIVTKDRDGREYRVGGVPSIKFFSNCTNLIRTLPALPVDANHTEDVDTKAEDHAYDALRYGIMSRPMSTTEAIFLDSRNISRPRGYRPVDPVFGH